MVEKTQQQGLSQPAVRTKIGYVATATSLQGSDVTYNKIRQVNNVLPVDIILEKVDNTSGQTITDLVNSFETAVTKLKNNDISYIILDAASSIIVPWCLGKYLKENTDILCDKVERWKHMKFFCLNNSLGYKGSLTNLLLIVRNLYRFVDVNSGASLDDITFSLKTNAYSGLKLPSKIFTVLETNDNAAMIENEQLKSACKSLGIDTVEIPVTYKYDDSAFNGIYEFNNIETATRNLNDWIDMINKGESTGFSAAVNGNLGDAFTNTIINTKLNLSPINGKQNSTLYEALNNTEGTNSRFLGNNYSYNRVDDANNKTLNTPLKIVQYSTSSSWHAVFNNILTRISGILPSEFFDTDPSTYYERALCALEIIQYILADVNGTTDVFTGLQDNRFRFDKETGRSRVCALLQSTNTPANTFELSELPKLYLNKPFEM
jgi:hypothetical protein